MTLQAMEAIWVGGERRHMLNTPLDDWLLLTGADINDFAECWAGSSTGCWRKYIGEWEIRDGRLYLVRFSPGFWQDKVDKPLDRLFPGFPDRVFAHWYSGTLRTLPVAVRRGIPEDPEQELRIQIKRGVCFSEAPVGAGYRLQLDEDLFSCMAPKRKHLQSRVSIVDIENHEHVADPLNAVPARPFGHLWAAWNRFATEAQPGEQIRSFQASYAPPRQWVADYRGYAATMRGRIVRFFIAEVDMHENEVSRT
jgi:hypothetical protein